MKTISKDFDKETKEISWSLQAVDRKVNVWIPFNQIMRFEDDETMDIIKTIYNKTSVIDIDPEKGNTDMIGVIGETMIDLGNKIAYVRFVVDDVNMLNIDTIESVSIDEFINFIDKRSSNLN